MTIEPMSGTIELAAGFSAVPPWALRVADEAEPTLTRYEVIDLAGWSTIVDLVDELLADPRRRWSRADADLVVQVLAERPGYAVHIPWRSAR